MIKTEFMKIYEELNEAIEDIDFKALDQAETEIKRLDTEINNLYKDYLSKIQDAKTASEAYRQFTKEIKELNQQIRDLQHTYERRVWYRVGYDDYDDDIEIDEEQYNKVKDKEDLLSKKVEELTAELHNIEKAIELQYEEESAHIKTKQAERNTHRDTSKNIKAQLQQTFAEVEPEVTAVVNYLNNHLDLTWKVIPNSLFYKDGRIQLKLATKQSWDGDSFDLEDFGEDGDYGELSDSAVENTIEYFTEDYLIDPNLIIEELNLPLVEDGVEKWYSIPNSDWELSNYMEDIIDISRPGVYNYSSTEATYWEPAESDYDIDGELILEAFLYISKKVKQK